MIFDGADFYVNGLQKFKEIPEKGLSNKIDGEPISFNNLTNFKMKLLKRKLNEIENKFNTSLVKVCKKEVPKYRGKNNEYYYFQFDKKIILRINKTWNLNDGIYYHNIKNYLSINNKAFQYVSGLL